MRTKQTQLRATITAAALGIAALAAATAPSAAALAPAGAAPHAGAAPPGRAGCGPGELCLWTEPDYGGTRTTYELTGLTTESCTALPEGSSAQALANRTARPVTTYQSAECEETGDFETYPGRGGGTWAPESPYQVRAFKIWES
ncbi:peptidase inhibitor family I36 protein [Streptomyces indicus]|uniref:Peptidase inhibitor family I36 n=1 Tax=Streptomyces indicus TaxID=417292 RepID=A0A1G9IL84_9ACTN|nr:peptidase inhibitor family I36 protein [Streptomyces indicus]SDL26018.1 Peptidase inhibitor family I36 [Streptomyces indicus]